MLGGELPEKLTNRKFLTLRRYEDTGIEDYSHAGGSNESRRASMPACTSVAKVSSGRGG